MPTAPLPAPAPGTVEPPPTVSASATSVLGLSTGAPIRWLAELGLCVPIGVDGDVDADCQDDADAGGSLVDADVRAVVSVAGEVRAECQQNTGAQADSLANLDVCAGAGVTA